MNNDILFIGGTHGNEPIGVEVLRALSSKRSDFDWLVGNPKALEQQQRFVEKDLNRSGPGDFRSSLFEERRAAQLIKKASEYRYTIDLHGAPADCGIFLLLTNLSEENLRLASLFSIPRIVYWPSISDELTGPLSEFFPCGLEIECGPKDDPDIQTDLQKILKDFLDNREEREQKDWIEILASRELYQVTGSLPLSDPLPSLRDFEETIIADQTVTPILANTYDRLGIACYTMKSVFLSDWLP